MKDFFCLWFVIAASAVVIKGIGILRRRRAETAERARREAEERSARPERERAEREASAKREREAGERRRRDDARSACELLYAQHAPEVESRLPKDTFEQFLERLLRSDLPMDVVERKAEEIQKLVRSHLDSSRGSRKAETVEQVQTWYDEQLGQLSGVKDERLRQSFEAMLLQQFHERMLRAMGDDA